MNEMKLDLSDNVASFIHDAIIPNNWCGYIMVILDFFNDHK